MRWTNRVLQAYTHQDGTFDAARKIFNIEISQVGKHARGQFFSEADNTYGDWIRYNLDKPAEYYYRGAFMDCIRAIDFACSLP